jgi:hypothetical protein
MQIKTTLRFYLAPLRMAIIKKTNVREDGGQRGRNLIHRFWEYKLVQPLRKSLWRLIKKTRFTF